MHELQIFSNPDFGDIRVLNVDNDPWWVLKDVCGAIGIKKYRDVSARLDEDEKDGADLTDAIGRIQKTTIINESGLYNVILRSDKPSAKKFKRWVTHEVLPAIRKTGGYQLPQMSTAEIVAYLANANAGVEKRLDNVEQKLETTLKVFSRPDPDHWKTDINEAIRALVDENGLSPVQFRGKLYQELERQAGGISLEARTRNLKARMKKQGHTYREWSTVAKIDTISKDKQLRAIFEGIVKKYQAIYGAE